MDLAGILELEPHGADVFVGVGPRYPWGGLYGGQIVAQGLRAAAATVDARFRVHSLHAYFIRRGDEAEPIRYEVDRTRDGRSFCTRLVVARQAVGAILTMSVSFQVDEHGPDVQIAQLPDIPGHEGLADEDWSPLFHRRWAIPRASADGRAIAWLRTAEPLGDDPVLQACALAYLSDDLPTDAVIALHPNRPAAGTPWDFQGDFEGNFMSASLDHAIWFHRPLSVDDWHVQEFTSHGLLSSRGLGIGHVLSADGTHAATIAQEVLLREAR